jgi:phenylalanyl-tRNA synthetase beta chain
VLRRTLLPGLLEVAARNLQATDSVALFELGFVYLPTATLPDEPRRVAVVLAGRRTPAAWDDTQGAAPAAFDFFDLKGVAESLVAALHLPLSFAPNRELPHLHPGKAADIVLNGKSVGTLGELHPKVRSAFGIAQNVLVAEFDAEALIAAVPDRYPYRPFSTLPAAKRDVAVIVADDIPAEKVLAELRAAGGELLTDVTLFDVYRGESVPAGTKSLAFALTYQPKEKTLTDKEIDKAHEKIEGRLRHMLKAKIRGKDDAK